RAEPGRTFTDALQGPQGQPGKATNTHSHARAFSKEGSMTLLAGFDIVTEISSAAVLKLIKSQMKLGGGVSVNPPFEITVPISGGGVTGNVHMIVDDVLLNLNQDDSATLTFNFSNTSLIAQTPALTITALDGSVTVKAPLALVPSNQTQLVPTANLAAAT